MSDGTLVERVARAISVEFGSEPKKWDEYKGEARAAIRAVAEWVSEHHQIDADGSVHLALTFQHARSEDK